MDGFDCLGTEVGFDYMSLLKGGAGLLSGAGGMMSSQQKGTPAAADAERVRLQMEKEAAERSANTMKTIAIVLGALVGVGLLGALAFSGRRAPVAPAPVAVSK